MVSVLLILLWAFTIAFTYFSARTDSEEGKIFDGTTLPMIGLGVLISLFWQNYINIGIMILIYIIGLIANRLKYLGGGDVKLLMGIQALIPMIVGIPTVVFILVISGISFIVISFAKGIDERYARMGGLALVSLLFGGVVELILYLKLIVGI